MRLLGCRVLVFHDVLNAPEIRRNVISILGLMKLSFKLPFHELSVQLTLGLMIFDFGIVLLDLLFWIWFRELIINVFFYS